MKANYPLVCNMGVFSPAQREAHVLTTTQLFKSVQSVQEADNGYEFTFPNESDLIVRIGEFVANERLCCPFLTFNLNVSPDTQPVSLTLTGPVGTREFLQAELDGAFQ